eukprot:CAMPEP_0170565154 /NCGR_PEP_ID=MMETSP0211-20121228/77088_1 /TAXON_ID=311385 /ORGANISM="Pseudokeronopsis sp., Strain OXSARD2" /LENGTH=93 /DNA_ID=CAMNT_0010885563 /DNA_START=877 /DNA_END=1155 /DNA_ORIENTATION=-
MLEAPKRITLQHLVTVLGAIFNYKKIKKESPEYMHGQIERVHGTLYNFSPAKINNLRSIPALNFILKNFFSVYSEDLILQDSCMKKHIRDYQE